MRRERGKDITYIAREEVFVACSSGHVEIMFWVDASEAFSLFSLCADAVTISLQQAGILGGF